MLKTKRKTYGNTWWGRSWIEALERIDSNRLARGKTYANTGRVLSVKLIDDRIKAKIKGSYYDSYEVKIALKPFTSKELSILRGIISGQPTIAVELSLGKLPEALLKFMTQKQIALMPSRWRDMETRCSCPDSSNPCKHLAAVYYVLANEIDQDPFLFFNLKGLKTAELIGMSGDQQAVFQNKENPIFSHFTDLEQLSQNLVSIDPTQFSFSLPRHDSRALLALLSDNPPFYAEGNFKEFLHNLYSVASASMGTLFPSPNEKPLLASRLFQFEFKQDTYSPQYGFELKISLDENVSFDNDQTSILDELLTQQAQTQIPKTLRHTSSILEKGNKDKIPLEVKRSYLVSLGNSKTENKPAAYEALAFCDSTVGLDYFLNASLMVDAYWVSDSFSFLNLLASFAMALVQAHLFAPELVYEGQEIFRIRYVPLIKHTSVEPVFAQLLSVMPNDIAHYQERFLADEGLVDILAVFITRLVHLGIGRHVDTTTYASSANRLLKLFTKEYLFRSANFTEKRISGSISNWLEKLHLGKRDIAPIIRIEPIKEENFELSVEVCNRKSAVDGFISLARLYDLDEKRLKKAVKPPSLYFGKPKEEVQSDVARQLVIAGDYLPELKTVVDSKGLEAPIVTLERMSQILLETASIMTVLGMDLILPKAFQKLVMPSLSVRAKLRKSNETGKQYLGLDDLLNFSYEIALGEESISAQDFKKLLSKTQGLVKFKDQYLLLRPSEVQSILKRLQEPLPDLDSPIQALYTAMTGEIQGLQFKADEALQRVLDNLTRIDDIDLPTHLNATLRAYQERGFRWLWTNSKKGFGSCIADDMGLGKTLQIITLLLRTKQENENGKQAKKESLPPSIVVCPTTLIGNWEKECARFAPGLNVLVYHGNERRFNLKGQDVLITSYGIFRRDLEKLSAKNWNYLIIDEAQNIKNSQTAQTKAIKSLKAKIRIAMTGTPVENRLTELWNIFDFINPGYLGTLSHFKTELANPIEKARDTETIEKLKRATSPFLLRRLKSDKSIISDLPEKLSFDEYCYLTSSQAAIYQNVVDRILKDIESSDGIERKGLIFKLMTALKQICNHPAHFANQGAIGSDLSGKAAKTIDLLKSILDSGEKALIFTQYTEMGGILERMIHDELGTEALFFHGKLSRQKRDEMVQAFQEDRQTRIMILSLKAGGTGLNLTAASQVIHYDLWWNPAVENQATDRAYRIGQKQKVLVHRLITLGTFEEKIDEMIKQKQELANLTVSTGENWITEMSNKQLSEIFNLASIKKQ